MIDCLWWSRIQKFHKPMLYSSPLGPLQELNGAWQPLDQPEYDDGDGAEEVDELVEPQIRVVRDVSFEFDGAVGDILGQRIQYFLGSWIRVQYAPISAIPRVHPNLVVTKGFVDFLDARC